jgi:AraC-like DNA-binding protein
LKQLFNWDNLSLMNSSPKNKEFLPLLGALTKIQFGLESPHPPLVILAARTREEFLNQKLPAHCRVSPRKIRGPRVPVRGKDKVLHPDLIARWPKDGLVEGVAPTLFFVLDGQADIHIADYSVHCHTGDILFCPPGIVKLEGSRPHYDKVTPASHCDLLVINITPHGIQNSTAYICHSRGEKHTMSAHGESCWTASHTISQMLNTLSGMTQLQPCPKSTFHLVTALIFAFMAELENGRCFNNDDFPSQSPSLEGRAPISKALEYIQNHLYVPLTIDKVARWVGLSRSAFVKYFHEETGESFQEHLTRLRLEQAKVLLSQTNLPVEHISKRVGLSSAQLRNLFRGAHQCTPREFRHSKTKT